MSKSQKIQWIIFIILFIIAVSELFYFFYYKPPANQQIPPPVPSVAVGIPSIIATTKIESGLQIENIITKAKTQGQKFTSYTAILKSLDQTTNYNTKIGKYFQLDNLKGDSWAASEDNISPIKISGPFIVRLNFNGTKEPSGIDLSGRLGGSDRIWWKNLIQIFFGVGNNGKQIYIDAKNNGSAPFPLYNNTFDNKIDGIYVLFNETGTSFLVTDLSYKEITFIDLNKATDNKFPEGLFPDKQFYIGYAVAPLSDLVVNDFSIL
jgi:hypothetical protein